MHKFTKAMKWLQAKPMGDSPEAQGLAIVHTVIHQLVEELSLDHPGRLEVGVEYARVRENKFTYRVLLKPRNPAVPRLTIALETQHQYNGRGNRLRNAIFDVIQAHPGIRANDVARHLLVGTTSAAHHLDLLESYGAIRRESKGRSVLYYPVHGPRVPQKRLTQNTHRIMMEVVRRPGTTIHELALHLGISKNRVHNHVSRCEAAGFVRCEGKPRRIWPQDTNLPALANFASFPAKAPAGG